MTSLTITEDRKYKKVRKDIYNGLDNDKDRWMQEYICIVFDIIEDKFKSYKQEHYNDMINAGVVGILTARNKFDESKGTKFTTYAYISIYNAVVEYIRSVNNVHSGRNKWIKYGKRMRELIKRYTDKDIQESDLYEQVWIQMRNETGMNREDYYILWMEIMGKNVSYEALKGDIGDWYDIVDKNIDIEEEIKGRETIGEVYKYIENRITQGMKRDICKEYINTAISGDKWKIADVAREYGVSRQYVAQVIEDMKNKMQEWMCEHK